VYSMSVILRQKRLSDMQKDFINNMTHEFKTPLSTIRISAGVFVTDERIKSDSRLLKYASIILEQNERLNKQVEKVLQLAKMDQGNIDLQIESCSLEDVLTPVIDSMRLRIEEAGGQLIADIPDSVPDIQADRLHLSNVLYNLLDNAAKYCVQAPFIQLRVQVDHQFVHIVVQDNGIGIGREHHTRVFDRFYRVPTGNIHNVKGFGLGLFYTKRICDAHGWKIRLNSQPGQGTTIAIQLPRMQSAKI
jgi:two-component system phosphate regulon sensor histidine kinase PhoR